jgi:hypothetical protein
MLDDQETISVIDLLSSRLLFIMAVSPQMVGSSASIDVAVIGVGSSDLLPAGSHHSTARRRHE